MKRITVMLLAAVLGVLCTAAQDCEVQPVEGGIYAGTTSPLGGYRGGSGNAYVTMGLSVSYNLPDTPIDCGVFMQLDNVERKFSTTLPDGSCQSEGTQNNRTLSIGLIGHYNFRQCKAVNPFAGLGIGVGFNDVVRSVHYSKGTSAVIMPQVGVEFWHLLRLTGYATICRQGYNCVGLTLGLSFGGRPRR